MNRKSKFQQFVSLVVSLGLMLQMILPAASIAAQPLAQTRPEPPVVVETNEETAVSATHQPAVLTPLTLSRAQSTFQADGTVVITYTLRNSLPPIIRPDAAPTDTITDTITDTLNAISAANFAADPNNVRDAQLTLQLTNGQTALQSASLPVDQGGGVFSFNLGDIPPLSSAELVVKLTIPSSAANFVELDSGAVANGRWRAIPVSASVSPIRLAPDGFAQWLTCTPDANCHDPYVIRKAAELGHDANAIFAFVRGLDYESYPGSLRGARGTLWSDAGNGYDQASLLIALLRASGIPAAYRLGSLSQSQAQTLISSMFPAVNAPSGLVSAGAVTADPANDPALLAEAQDHAWSEAYLPGGGWTALDPAFAAAQPGNVFGAASGGQLAELPDNVRHKVTASLVVEKYSAFPIGGSNLYTIEPLTAVFNTVELAGEPLVFAHLVESDFQGGLAFASAEHTYTPYFVVGEAETLVEGEAFGELLSNFPFGQDFVVAEWLDFTVTAPDGGSETYRRELFDDIGYAARTGGGLIGNLQRDETARLSLMSSWTTLVAAYNVPAAAINDAYQQMVSLSLEGIAANEAIAGLQDTDNPSPEQTETAQAAVVTFGKIARLGQRLHLLKFAAASDQAHDYAGDAFLVKAYPDSPRLFTVGWERNDQEQTENISFDLLRNKIRAVAYPGQTDVGSEAFLFWRALLDMGIEYEVLKEIAPAPLLSVGAVFDAAAAADIPLERITFGTLDELAALPLSDEAKARITTALTANPNQYVIVPAQMIALPGAAEATTGWLQIDNETLEVIDTMENGQHMAATQYAILGKFSQKIASFLGGFAAGFFSHTMGFWIGFFGQMPLGSQDIGAVIAASKASAESWGKQAEKACNKKSDKKWCKQGVSAGNALGAAILAESDPPLQETLFVLPLDVPVVNEETAVSLFQSASLSGSAVNANITTGMVAVSGEAGHAWTTAGQNSLLFDSLSIGSAQVYQNGSLVGTGPVTAVSASSTQGVPAPNTAASAQITTAGLTLSGSADGALTLFAPNPALVGGSQFESYSLNLNAPGAYTLVLSGATVTVNGATYSGELEVVSSAPAQIAGAGASAAPNFAASASFTPDGGGFIVADASGSLSVGGGAVQADSGFALGGVSAPGGAAPAGAANAFVFNGSADFFALDLSSSASTMPADDTASFDADIVANFSGSYTLTVHAPAGWDVSANAAGLITAQPPVGAAAGAYTLVVSAQSQTYPDLFAAAQHVVTVTAVHGVSVSVEPDPTITVPWGPAYDVINFDTAVGRLQIPQAAFHVTVQNTSSSARDFNVDVSGLPFGWTIFGGEAGSDSLQLPLEAGETVQLGLYISPTTSLPPVGNSYPFNVTATALDDGAVTAVSAETFTMPAIAYPAVTVNPTNLYAAANSSSAFDVTVTNIGNTSGSFELVSTVPVNDWSLTNLQSSLFLSPGQSDTRSVTVTVTTGDPGVDYPVSIGAAAPTLPYTPTTAVNLYLVSALTQPIYQAASCTVGSAALEAAIQSLAGAVGELEESCSSGNCNLSQRDTVVDALRSVAAYARTASPLVTQHTAFTDIADDLAAHTADADIEADLDALTLAVTDLGAELCEVEQHGVDARFSPYVAAILLGDSASFSLDVTNKGTIATTYAITVSGLPGGDLTFNEAINPGATLNLPITPSPAVLGVFDLTAAVVPVAPDVTLPLTETAVARLNVVDKFVQVTQVLPDPPFVETGTSSATIRAEIANVSGVAQAADGVTAVLAPNGSTLWSNNTPLNLFAGNPRLYELGVVDTSGWDEGVYTVTLNLLDGGGDLIPDGFNYGYLSVGQALTVTQAVQPELVAPGTVTVTNIITTSIRVSDIGLEPLSVTESPAAAKSFYFPPPADLTGDPAMADSLLFGPDPAEWAAVEEEVETAVADPATIHLSLPAVAINETINSEPSTDNSEQTTDNGLRLTDSLLSLSIGGVFTRTEQNEAAIAYVGVWTNIGTDRASGGSYWRADDPGDTATFSFTGPWLNLGFIGSNFSGRAEVFIDGVSQGVLDLYRREETAFHFIYDGLTNAPHTVSIQVLGSANPYASNDFVQLDYIDVWDGSTLPDGLFEHTDNRVILSAGWFTTTHAAASGGSYIRDNVGTVWFPFSGDSFTFHTIAQNNNGWLTLYVDGQYLTTLVNYNPDLVAQNYSFEGFGPGPHLLQVSPYGDFISVDAFSTPGGAPFTDPSPPAVGYTRYEEDHRAWLYNGVPFTQTAQSWSRNTLVQGDIASGGQVFGSSTTGNTASLTVSGQWVQVGFSGGSTGGVAELFIDGLSQGTVNLYRRENSAVSRIFDGLSNGPHTISVTVISGQVLLDYVDVWDGSPLADGVFETFPNGRFYLSSGWGAVNDVDAVNGRYWRTNGGNAWFPFTGDSVSYRAFATDDVDEARLYLDEQYMGTLDLFSSADISRTFSFEGLGAGVHILRVEQHRGLITLEEFAAPGVAPFYSPPAPSGVTRYEEDDPALLYNGLPFTQTVTTWNRNASLAYHASEGYYAYSSTAGNSVSLSFTGNWFGVGFLTWRVRGIADIYLDGVLLDSVDLFTLSEDTKSVYYDVAPGAHTVSITVNGGKHPNAVGTEMALDYIDVWDGSAEADGTFQESDLNRLIYSPGWDLRSDAAAAGGTFARNTNNGTVWFPFTGDSVTFEAFANRSAHEIEIKIDGVSLNSEGRFDSYREASTPLPFSFAGLGSGPHVLEVRHYRYDANVDSFTTPGVPPFYQEPPAPTGVVRYEEDDPALRYNGFPFQQSEYCFLTCWFMSARASASNAYVGETRRAGDWVELDFFGSWVGAGFATGSSGGVAEIFIDGSSMMTVSLTSPQDVKSVYFSDLLTDTHTISVTLLSGTLYLDFFDVWDGATMPDGWFDADLDQHRGPYHFSNLTSWTTFSAPQRPRLEFANEDDVVTRSTISSNTHLWFAFTGNDLMFLPLQRIGETVEVFIDGVSQGVVDLTAVYSDQPIALYYTDLGDGPHVVNLNAVSGPYIDGFHVNPPHFLPYTPIVEWTDDAPTDVYTTTFANFGLVSTVGIGDLQGDGVVEIVVPSSNGQMYVYRGDGQDTGDGDPILWQSGLVGTGAEPTLVDLDGDSQAEIVVMGSAGTAAFHADGSVYWFRDDIRSSVESAGWGGSSAGNLDLEPGPEIALASYNGALYVLDHDGTTLFSLPTGTFPAVPVMADLTGDGILDLIYAQNKTITVYDAFNGYNVVWSHTHTYPGFYGQAFGSPAVIDVDGKQPGGDDGPEVVINWGHYVDVFDADGTFLWNYYFGSDFYRRPSPITVADVDGDNEIELLTASALQSGFLVFGHELVVLNANGALLWSQTMGDTSASASGVATQDLDGDGVWEVLWNGFNEGFTLLDGPTGEKLFNEEFSESGTFIDYPALGDVDGDGYAEVVTGGRNGLVVYGHDGIWGDSRPLWNQHNYHVTNINDDWSVPIAEPNNWDVHNTYRTQTPNRAPAPAYQVAITYTAVLTNATVLTDTATRPLTAAPPDYAWEYVQDWTSPVLTTTFASLLPHMQPGEVRQISEGVVVDYQLPSGVNRLTLPPLFVTAAHLGEVAPAAQSIPAGGTAVYTLTLTNPGSSADTFALAVGGVPADWLNYPSGVTLNPGESVVVTITVTVPGSADADVLPLFIDVSGSGGSADSLQASLTIFNGLDVALTPASQDALPGAAAAYTLTLTNYETVERTYALTPTGQLSLDAPASLTVGANGTETAVLTATAPTPGPYAFTLAAAAPAGSADSADAVLNVLETAQAALTLTPDPAVAGPLSTAVLTLTVTNLSSLAETFDLQVDAPAGWNAVLQDNSGPVNSVALPPAAFNSAELQLRLTPDGAAAAGDYEVTVTAVAQSSGAAAGSVTGAVTVLNRGVQVAFLSGPTSLDPRDSGVWQVRVTNTGTAAGTFDLETGGIMALAGSLSTPAVSLAAGASQTIQLTVDGLDAVLPQTYLVNVAARSQADPRIVADDTTSVDLLGYEAVQVGWLPAAQTVTNTLTAQLTLLITNTGNVSAVYDLTTAVPGAVSMLSDDQILLPAHNTVQVVATVEAPAAGVYTLSGTADSTSSAASDSAQASVTFVVTNQAPVVEAGDGQTVNEGTAVVFNGAASDPDGDSFSLLWDFGDGGTAAGTLTPSHTFGDNGVYNVTLTVTDTGSLVGMDSVLITVNNVAPTVNAGADLTTVPNTATAFSGSFTDPGALDTHTILWDFGDGQTAAGTLTPSHSYTAPGEYIVTLTVTDDDGGVDSDTLLVLVKYQLLLPVILKP